MNEIVRLVNSVIANKLFKAGVKALPNEEVDGNLCYVFEITPDKQAIAKRIMNGA